MYLSVYIPTPSTSDQSVNSLFHLNHFKFHRDELMFFLSFNDLGNPKNISTRMLGYQSKVSDAPSRIISAILKIELCPSGRHHVSGRYGNLSICPNIIFPSSKKIPKDRKIFFVINRSLLIHLHGPIDAQK